MNLDRKTQEAALRLKKSVANVFRAREKLAAESTEFHNRYRGWCLTECKAEWARGFRFVRTVQDNSTTVFFDFVEPLTLKAKKEAIVAICKRMHWTESMSELESQISESYRQHWSMPFQLGGNVVSALRTTPQQLEIQEKFFRRSPSKRMIAQSLRKALKRTSGTDFGRLLEDRPSVLVYEKQIASWHVVTSFELFGHSQLRYNHHIHALAGGKRETKIYSGISILNWTGIHADSTWSWLLPRISRLLLAPYVNSVCTFSATLKDC